MFGDLAASISGVEDTAGAVDSGPTGATLDGFGTYLTDAVQEIDKADPTFAAGMGQLNTWLESNWINTGFGEWVDGKANSVAESAGLGSIIGNGVNGTAADPDGGHGGALSR